MIKRTFLLSGVNREALNAQLAAALGPVYAGFADHTTGEGLRVTVNLTVGAVPEDIDRLIGVMNAHNPLELTPEQAARQAQMEKLAAARRDYRGDDLMPEDYAGESATVQTLAKKIAWLEQEIASLRPDI